ncbi:MULTISPECIES: SusC/RagA family TonB-linked outer membrane protein [Sphingobacterium]|uniref:SusC/RagA family TonB-linked outer membrane protein n=1 Tax=Sphingobacterium TaxID=28453 RepID=UPI000E9D4C19|nr:MULTISPECIES: TonB-dependent receptor [Sphingobacterium]HAU53735.1 TonB-dependent receptor [Sphingobacterium sp.]HCX54971.1 TonB-dependent receptor [Sphingobacterium sp.]
MIKSITKMGCFVLFLFLALGSIGLPVFAQQNIRLSGKVTNKKGEALQGVTVRIKGKSQGTSTDATGKYQLDVAPSSTVVFSQVGMKEQERTVGNQRQLDVTLEDSDNALDEIVVTGYGGVAKKRDLTGAISSVNAKKIEERQPINLFDALQGQAAGVLIVNDGGGAPGATGSIQVRGTSTLNGGNGPLYLVDGVINPDGATINPTDIENIEVLKDAASASIYGSRAANGVILITTKRGSEGRPMVNVNYNHLFGRLAHYIPVSNSAEVRAFRYIQGLNTNTDSINPSFNSDNDLQRLLLGNLAQKKEIKMSVSGGQKNLRYYSSLNYLDDKSIILNSYAKRLQSRINVEYQFSSKLRYSNNISFSWQKGNTIPIGNTIRVVMDRPAYSLIYYPDGSLTSYIGSKRNPVANALFEKNIDETYSGQLNNQLDYQIRDDLKFTTLFNVRLDNLQNTQFSPRFLSANKDQNSGTNEFNKTFTWEFQSYLNYNKTFAQDHNVTALLGFSSDRRRYDRFHSEYMNSVNEEVLVTFPDYLTPSKTYTTATANASASVFSRIGYNYKGRYLVQGSYRRDGSSRFGAANKWGNFLSASAAWRFSDENFMKWAKPALVDAKLRYSIGQLGNDKVGDYESYTKVAFGGSYNGVGGAALTSTFGNNRIKWETTTQNNVGLDLTFLNGRLGFTADYYVKTTTDLLYPRELAKETGYAKVNVNLGTIRNRGMEFVISGKPIVTPDFSWEVNGNISFERGKIVKLADGIPFFPGNKWYAEEGGRIGNFYGWRNLGVYSWDESNAYNDNWEKLTLVLDDQGKPMYRDGKAVYTFNGSDYQGTVHQLYAPDGKLKGGDAEWLNNKKDSLINDEDRMILGNATPNFYFGFMQTFRYKRFTLNVLFNGSFGGEVYNALLQRQNYPSNTGAGSPDMVYNVWRKPGDVAKYPNYVERNNRGNLKTNQNSLYIEDATFVRLSSARLAYTFDPQLINRLKMKGLTAFVYGSNLLTWTNYRGYDPEFSTNNPLTPGEDDGRYPRRREFGFGVNINF